MELDRARIWIGLLQWDEKKADTKNKNYTWKVPFMVSAAAKNGELEVKTTSWPSTLNVLLMPKILVDKIGQDHFENSKTIDFYSSLSSGRDRLVNIMSTGYAAYLDFPTKPNCDIDVILLKLTDEKKFIGYVPNDQAAFIQRVSELVEQEKSCDKVAREPLRPALADTSNVVSGGTSDSETPTSGSSIRASKPESCAKKNKIPHNSIESSWHQPQQVPEPIVMMKPKNKVIKVEPQDKIDFQNNNMLCEPQHEPVQPGSLYHAFLNYLAVKNESDDEMNSEDNNQRQEVQPLVTVKHENVPVKVEPMSETITREENLRKIENLTTTCLTAQKNLAKTWSALSKLQEELQEAHNLELQFGQQDFYLNPFHIKSHRK